MAHGLNKVIKREFDYNNSGIKNQISQTVATTLSPQQQSAVPSSSSSIMNNNNNSNNSNNPNNKSNVTSTTGVSPSSAKMGSRRIFTPQFKLQVLESYRNDTDCKGNQRATARKYGIHRRQIQKWLQCESNLRSSVANLNQNNNNNNNGSSMKHHHHHHLHHTQFHHVNGSQIPILSTGVSTSTSTTSSSYSLSMAGTLQQQQFNNISSSNCLHHNQQQQQQYKSNLLSLDVARHNVALTPLTLAHSAPIPLKSTSSGTKTPSRRDKISSNVSVPPSAATSLTAGIIPHATRSIEISINNNCRPNAMGPQTTLKPSLIYGAVPLQAPYKMNLPSSDSTILTNTPVPTAAVAAAAVASSIANVVSSSVPILPIHYSHHQPQHQSHQAHLQQPIYYQHYINQHEHRLLMPSASLPVPSINSVSAAGSPPVLTNTETTNRPDDDLRDYQTIGKATTAAAVVATAESCYKTEEYLSQPVYENIHHYNCTNNIDSRTRNNVDFCVSSNDNTGTTAPIDLSLRPKHRNYKNDVSDNHSTISEKTWYLKPDTTKTCYSESEQNNSDVNKEQHKNINNILSNNENNDKGLDSMSSEENVVDLSYRKRKNENDDGNVIPTKIQKLEDDNKREEKQQQQHDQDQQQVKPVKLFKPYLLDEDDEKKIIKTEHRDPIIWSHHPTCVNSTSGYENQQNNNNFPKIAIDTSSSSSMNANSNYPFPVGSPSFQSQSSYSSPQHDRTGSITPISPPTPVSVISSSSPYWYPKGSPVSGYESASSTFSDPGDYYHQSPNRVQCPNEAELPTRASASIDGAAYSLDLKMHPIDSYYHEVNSNTNSSRTNNQISPDAAISHHPLVHPHQYDSQSQYHQHRGNNVHKWLDQEINIRQGIALYV